MQTFTAKNITAIIAASTEGGNRESVLQRAGVPVGISSLQKWLTQGRKDHAAREETAFGVFYALWRKNYAGRVLDREPERMSEMKRALTMMDADTIDGKRPVRRKVADVRDVA